MAPSAVLAMYWTSPTSSIEGYGCGLVRVAMFRATRFIAAALLVACVPATATAKWTRLRTEHFVFVGDAPKSDIRRVAQKLDEFREVLTRALGGGATKSPLPTVVIMFRIDSSFTPYKPYFQGHPIEVAG